MQEYPSGRQARVQLIMPALFTRHGKWRFALALCGSAIVLALLPDVGATLRYDRPALAAGEVWRVLTAHFAHINNAHLLYNLLGLYLICELLWADLPLRHGIGIMVAAMLGIAASLWWFHPGIVWYVGLSGVLHGLWAGTALAQCKPVRQFFAKGSIGWNMDDFRRSLPYLALAILLLKLYVESLSGYDAPIDAEGLAVVNAAHFHGAVAGLVYIATWRIHRMMQRGRE